MVLGAFFLICLVTCFFFVGGKTVVRVLGKGFLMVISRILGLTLAVIGTQMLIDGIRAAVEAVPGSWEYPPLTAPRRRPRSAGDRHTRSAPR